LQSSQFAGDKLSWYGFLQQQTPLHSHDGTLLASLTPDQNAAWLNERSMFLKTEDPAKQYLRIRVT
jgi:hypothetical protein